MSEWQAIETAPEGKWLLTKRDGEDGDNVCCYWQREPDEPPEWIEMGTGRTTVTHHSFLPPTHWKPLAETPHFGAAP